MNIVNNTLIACALASATFLTGINNVIKDFSPFQSAASHVEAVSTQEDESPTHQKDSKDATRKEKIAEHLATKYNRPYEDVRQYVHLAWQEAEKHPDVTPELILAVIQKESSLQPTAASSYGAHGLMQVVPRFHSEKIERNESLKRPEVNIRVGTQILQEYLSASRGNLTRALKKYSGNAKGYEKYVRQKMNELKRIRD